MKLRTSGPNAQSRLLDSCFFAIFSLFNCPLSHHPHISNVPVCHAPSWMILAELDRWVSQEVVADILGLVHFMFLPRDPGDIVGTGGAWPFLSSKFTATRAFPSVERLTTPNTCRFPFAGHPKCAAKVPKEDTLPETVYFDWYFTFFVTCLLLTILERFFVPSNYGSEGGRARECGEEPLPPQTDSWARGVVPPSCFCQQNPVFSKLCSKWTCEVWWGLGTPKMSLPRSRPLYYPRSLGPTRAGFFYRFGEFFSRFSVPWVFCASTVNWLPEGFFVFDNPRHLRYRYI